MKYMTNTNAAANTGNVKDLDFFEAFSFLKKNKGIDYFKCMHLCLCEALDLGQGYTNTKTGFKY